MSLVIFSGEVFQLSYLLLLTIFLSICFSKHSIMSGTDTISDKQRTIKMYIYNVSVQHVRCARVRSPWLSTLNVIQLSCTRTQRNRFAFTRMYTTRVPIECNQQDWLGSGCCGQKLFASYHVYVRARASL